MLCLSICTRLVWVSRLVGMRTVFSSFVFFMLNRLLYVTRHLLCCSEDGVGDGYLHAPQEEAASLYANHKDGYSLPFLERAIDNVLHQFAGESPTVLEGLEVPEHDVVHHWEDLQVKKQGTRK